MENAVGINKYEAVQTFWTASFLGIYFISLFKYLGHTFRIEVSNPKISINTIKNSFIKLYCERENLTVKPPLVFVTGKEEDTAGIVLL